MVILFILILAVLLIVLIIKLIKNHFVKKKVLDAFKHSNVIVCGPRGTGKDVIFQWVIKMRKEEYYSNIPYGLRYRHITLKDVSVFPNTYVDFISNDITKIKKCPSREGKDIYISDGGIYLPSQMDSNLHKTFPSMPIYYALSRHLYNSNIHINTQSLERVWKSLREQADFYILCVQTIHIFNILITRFIAYDRYDSCLKKLRPLSPRKLNKFSKAEADTFEAQNGYIKRGFIIQLTNHIYFDSRYFHKVLFGRKAPTR